eukprot:5936994-Pleurochrysis_carterae.AAC.4
MVKELDCRLCAAQHVFGQYGYHRRRDPPRHGKTPHARRWSRGHRAVHAMSKCYTRGILPHKALRRMCADRLNAGPLQALASITLAACAKTTSKRRRGAFSETCAILMLDMQRLVDDTDQSTWCKLHAECITSNEETDSHISMRP